MTDVTTDTAVSLISFVDGMTPFSITANDVIHSNRTILRQLGSVILVSNSVRNTLNIADSEVFDNIILRLMTDGVTIKRVNRVEEFFNGNSRFVEISQMPLVDAYEYSSKLGLNISIDDLMSFIRYEESKKRITSFFDDYGKNNVPAGGSYPLAPKPNHAFKLVIKKAGKSKSISNGSYTLGLKAATEIWNAAIPIWRTNAVDSAYSTSLGSVSFTRSYGSGWNRSSERRTAVIYANKIEIGCQTISRWEVEQMALDLGLSFN